MSHPYPGRYVRTAEYAALPTAVGAARREVVQTLKDWGLLGLIDTAELLVSELVTNAVKATGIMSARPRYTELEHLQRVVMQLRVERDGLFVLVWDSDPQPPVRRHVSTDDESGRGLQLVDAMSQRWGYYQPSAGGKVVWFELSLTVGGGEY